MDERAARRPNLELVKAEDQRTSSGVVPAKPVDIAGPEDLGINTGAILDGKYLVGPIIGAGAVGIVFEAKNVELDETVAIKCLRPEMLVDPDMVARFAREAKAAAAIKTEYVATVYDVGTTPEGVPYIVMEYLEGKDLGTVVAEAGTVNARTAVEYALQVCEALAVAHSKGIVHRDIKPENLLLTERAGGMRIVKVLDFGISKTALTGSIFQSELPLVKTVSLMGTPLYMSPEQVRVSDSIDVRSDIWSLGMVIYEILTGQTAFRGQSITEICAAILEAPPDPIELHRSDLPAGLVEVITTCLHKDVTKRYQNIAELALALMPFGPKRSRLNVERAVAVLKGAGHLDPSVRVNSTVPPSPSDSQLPSIPRPPTVPEIPGAISEPALATIPSLPSEARTSRSYAPETERRKSTGVILGVLAASALVVGALVFMRGRSSPAESAVEIGPRAVTAPVTATAPAPGASTSELTAHAAAPAVLESAPKPAATVKPAWATAPRPHVQPAVKPTTVATAATPPLPKPKATGKPNDEPDLGY